MSNYNPAFEEEPCMVVDSHSDRSYKDALKKVRKHQKRQERMMAQLEQAVRMLMVRTKRIETELFALNSLNSFDDFSFYPTYVYNGGSVIDEMLGKTKNKALRGF